MNLEESAEVCLRVIPEKRRDKLEVLRKVIWEGTYKIKAEDIAEKILRERVFQLALTLSNYKYQKCGNN